MNNTPKSEKLSLTLMLMYILFRLSRRRIANFALNYKMLRLQKLENKISSITLCPISPFETKAPGVYFHLR